jgi:serpin B
MALTPHASREVNLLEGREERQPSTELTEEDIHQHIAGNNTFALELYHVLEGEEGNLFFSPYSISASLGMAYCGARSRTYEEIGRTLHFSLPPAALSSVMAKLDEELGRGNELKIANSLWVEQSYRLKSSFLKLITDGYGTEPHTVNFASSPESAREEINSWVKRKTAGKIKDLIPSGGVDSTTSLVLANAIHFNGTWEYRFQPLPEPRDFHLLDGKTVKVPMMSVIASLKYACGNGFQALVLPYTGGMSMLLLVPDQGTFQTFQDSLSGEKIPSILISLEEQTVTVTMPKYEYASGFRLREALESLGMKDPFSPTANFSGMSNGPLQIDEVFHKAFVHVDEQGTEAAAATATTMSKGLVRSVSVNVDRPFIFLIRHDPTGTVLFIGRVINPE